MANTPNPRPKTTASSTGLVGKTTIDDGVVAKIAGIAAREVAGVYALGGGAARVPGAIRGAFNTKDLSQGINVEVGEEQVAVDVTIVAEYPVALQDVSNKVRASVYNALQEYVGMEVTEVNVTVDDVHLPSDDEEESEETRVQ
ncbi:MAG TPA: Asp23/Gls24 family envelope stress response protein [Candidatus Agrococcus pullicola]|uniref:Asp23/Gls24 family envelope stress response protein n=1 Tax=Candidatus Agrococcus pullicola TaxID=2838429 RepID=A0A9D2CBC7_9MICO|nr:Asp23/Gls24 family envelope stress response protein [Candidatus Agrococcus pullicola]